MESAFGIDHGEVEKALGFGSLGAGIGRLAGQGAKKAGQTAGRLKPAAGVGGFKGATQRAGFGGMKAAGIGMKRVSQFAQQRPGLTGGLAAGGAAAGAGAGAGMMNRRRF